LQALEVYDANTMPFIIGFALLVAMGSGFWLARRSRTATIIEYSTLTAAIKPHRHTACPSGRPFSRCLKLGGIIHTALRQSPIKSWRLIFI
ncbi:hypothetical protein, partial [Falsigemmobacter intermedius]